MFEYVYFARPDSMLCGRNVHTVRKALGRQLAREYPVDADIVIPVPDSGMGAALGYAQESGLPFDMRPRSATTTWAAPSSSPARASGTSA